MAALKKDIVGKEILKLVDAMHEEKKISARRHLRRHRVGHPARRRAALRRPHRRRRGADGPGIHVHIDRATGDIMAKHGEEDIDPETLGRIAAQSAKQVMIQKIREAESDTVFNEFAAKKGELVVGTIQRIDAGTAIVSLGKTEAMLPRSEQIPGETHHVGERVKAVVLEVRKTGPPGQDRPEPVPPGLRARRSSRRRSPRSRTAPSTSGPSPARPATGPRWPSRSHRPEGGLRRGLRRRPRQPDQEHHRGTQRRADRHRPLERLAAGADPERPPAGSDQEVFTYPRLGRAIVLVTEDQLSLAIGRRGQNVRLASKLVGWDIEIMTHDELGEALERAERWFASCRSSRPGGTARAGHAPEERSRR